MKLKNYNVKENELHPFHLVTPSPWPLTISLAASSFVWGLVKWMHSLDYAMLFLHVGIFGLTLSLYGWFRDIIIEATWEGQHTRKVQRGLRIGMVLFIVSEAMFFFSFFFAFYHASLTPTMGIGYVWPPKGIQTLDPFELPLLNTIILLSSGASLTWAHRSMVAKNRRGAAEGLSMTIFLGIIFTCLQAIEYNEATFSITDGIYGSIFYITTGFHGIHVIIGTIFLTVQACRIMSGHFGLGPEFGKRPYLGFETAAWYWHFVDVVWLFLYICIYCLGS